MGGDVLKDARAYREKLRNIFVKYKYVMIVAGVGLLLIFWPFGREGSAAQTSADTAPLRSADDAEALGQKIAVLLAQAEGVGRVEVMLSLASDSRFVYAEERTQTREERAGDGASNRSEESVKYLTVRQESGGESPVLLGSVGPAYRGAVVICDGADHAGVRFRVISAVSALTGLTSDRITVLKMK